MKTEDFVPPEQWRSIPSNIGSRIYERHCVRAFGYVFEYGDRFCCNEMVKCRIQSQLQTRHSYVKSQLHCKQSLSWLCIFNDDTIKFGYGYRFVQQPNCTFLINWSLSTMNVVCQCFRFALRITNMILSKWWEKRSTFFALLMHGRKLQEFSLVMEKKTDEGISMFKVYSARINISKLLYNLWNDKSIDKCRSLHY